MATRAHSTRAPLLPPPGVAPPLLPPESGRGPGPVTVAIHAVRSAELSPAADRAIEAIRDGLAAHFADPDRQRVRELRRRIARRIEADIALLDALDGDADLEDEGDTEPSLGSLNGTADLRGVNQLRLSGGGDGDREAGDDPGIADTGGLAEQRGRQLRLVAEGLL